MKWIKPYVLNLILAMSVSLRNGIEVTNRDVNKNIVEKSMVTTPFSQKCEGDHQDPFPEKENIRYRNHVISNIHMYIYQIYMIKTYTHDHICIY